MSVDPSHFLPAANGGKPPLLKLQNITGIPVKYGNLFVHMIDMVF